MVKKCFRKFKKNKGQVNTRSFLESKTKIANLKMFPINMWGFPSLFVILWIITDNSK